METTEYLLQLARKISEQAEELRATIAKLDDVPVRTGKGNAFRELIVAGYGHDAAWSACNRLIEQRRDLGRHASALQAEGEILIGIADDLIGKSGRLV
jgi:hypothetical protein